MAKPTLDLATVKAHLRVAHDAEDDLIATFTQAAVDHCLSTAGWAGQLEEEREDMFIMLHVESLKARSFRFQYPVEEVTSVSRRGLGGEWTAVASDKWELKGNPEAGFRLVLADDQALGTYKALWTPGLTDLPGTMKVAALFLIGHYYENRSAVLVGQGVAAIDIPQSVKSLLDPWRSILFA